MSSQRFRKVLGEFFNWIFPNNQCICCGEELRLPDARYSLCAACREKLFIKHQVCLKCDKPLKTGGEYCGTCQREARYFERNFSCFDYSDTPRKLFFSYKFNANLYKTHYISSFFIDKYLSENINADIVCAVPMNRRHYIERGYNQSELLARDFCERMKLPFSDNLKKKKGVRRQLGLSHKQRLENAKDSYYLQGKDFEGKRVLVIDDVFTTGGTMNSVSKVLLEQGKADSVIGLTLCNVEEKIG